MREGSGPDVVSLEPRARKWSTSPLRMWVGVLASVVLVVVVIVAGFRFSHHSTSGASPGTCESLIGQWVNPKATCTDSAAARGSFPCYRNHERQGQFYWIDYPENGSMTLIGRPGGVWYGVPHSWSVPQMASKVGC